MVDVLFADDEPHFLTAEKNILEARERTVAFVKRGAAALEFLHEHKVGIVVLDIMMGFDTIDDEVERGELTVEDITNDAWTGVRLYMRIRSEFPGQKMIIRTVYSEEDVRTKFPGETFDLPIFTKGSSANEAFM